MKLLGFGVALVAFWYIPFLFFGAMSRYGIVSPFTWGSLTIPQIFGLPGTGFTRLAPWTVLLAVIGAIMAFRRRGFSRFLLFWSSIFMIYLVALYFNLSFIYGGVSFPHRFLPWSSIFISMLGGYGLQVITGTLSNPKKINTKTHLGGVLMICFIVLIALPITLIERNDQKAAGDHLQDYQLAFDIAPYVKNRVAISSNLGGVTQTFNLVSNQSQPFNYQIQSAPNLPWLGFTNAFLFGDIGTGSEVVRLCRWFGIEYVVLTEREGSLWKYAPDEFETIWSGNGTMLLRYRSSTDTVSVTPARKILVIADSSGYENFFWSLIFTEFDPETVLLITRSRFIDDYDLNNLQQFDVVVLYGYDYRRRGTAFQVIDEYVKGGGRLFIDTGYSPDSNAENIPLPCPVSRTEATDFGMEWKFTIADMK